jgi:hypothetical protein
LNNAKRLGRYNHILSNADKVDSFTSPSYLNEIASSFYRKKSWKALFDLDKPFFGHKSSSLEKEFSNAKKIIEKSTKLINKFESRDLACTSRAKSIPENATIRKEYIKCGKQICERKHGPYYYAYWKDPESKKLKKKYIGNHMPKNKD